MRDSQGKFLKGHTGNAGGRPKASITAALRERVDPARVAEFLIGVMDNPAGRMPERLAAAQIVYDRLEGKSLNRSEIVAEIRQVDPFADLSDEELAALEARELAVLRAIDLPDLLTAGDPDEPADLVDVVQEGDLTPGSEARAPSAAARSPESGKTPGAAEAGIAQMAARSRRGRSEP